jgi:hypothetical protein
MLSNVHPRNVIQTATVKMTQDAISISQTADANAAREILSPEHAKILLTQIFAAKSNAIQIKTVTTIHFAHGTLAKTVANVLDHRFRVALESAANLNALHRSVMLMEMVTTIPCANGSTTNAPVHQYKRSVTTETLLIATNRNVIWMGMVSMIRDATSISLMANANVA